MAPDARGRRLLVAAGVVAVLSLGLPWSSTGAEVTLPPSLGLVAFDGVLVAYELPGVGLGFSETVYGFEHPVRVTGAVAAVTLWLAVARRSRPLVVAALVVGASALPLGLVSDTVWSGRIAYAFALALAAAALLGRRTTSDAPGSPPPPSPRDQPAPPPRSSHDHPPLTTRPPVASRPTTTA